MQQVTLKYLKENNLILFRALRGSHAHGTNTEESDEDQIVLYILPLENLLGLEIEDDIHENKNDIVGYEISKFCKLLIKSNPSALELLFTPEDCILYKHPSLDIFFKNREKFISKQIKDTLVGYAYEQIRKASGQNKMQNMEMEEVKRKTPLDFIYSPYFNGSRLFIKELKEHKLKQEYCGLSSLPHMNEMYAVFYDYRQHVQREKLSQDQAILLLGNIKNLNIISFLMYKDPKIYDEIIISNTNYKYKGLIKNLETSNDIALSSIPKCDQNMVIQYVQFRKDSYSQHCKKYKEYQDWKINRNKNRYKTNKEHGQPFDSKNAQHVARLLQMGIEIGEGSKELIIRRPPEHVEYLLDIKKGNFDLHDLLEKYKGMIPVIDDLFKTVDLPEIVDPMYVNKLLINFRKDFYKTEGYYITDNELNVEL